MTGDPTTPMSRQPCLRARLGRPRRRLHLLWQEGRINPDRLAAAASVLVLVVFGWLTCLLVTGRAEGLDAVTQVAFLLALGASGTYLSWALHRVWHRRWRNAFFGILALVTLYVVALSVVGFSGCVGPLVPGFTQVYYALLLLTGGSPDIWGRTGCAIEPFAVQVAEYMAMAVLFAAVLRVIAEVTSNWFTRHAVKRAGRVILVAGLNEHSLPVIRELAADSDGAVVAVVEPDPDHPLLAQVRRTGAKVIEGEISNRPRDRGWLTGAVTRRGGFLALDRAYLLGDDDQVNIADAEIIRQTIASLGARYKHEHLPPPRIVVRVDRYLQGRHYAAEQVRNWGHDDDPRAFIATMGQTQLTAHALAQRIIEVGRPDHTIVVGESDLSEAFLHEWRFQQASASFLADSLASPTDAVGQASLTLEFLRAKSCLSAPVERPSLPAVDELLEAQRRYRRTTVLLAGPPDAYSLRELEQLARQLDGERIRLFAPRSGTRGIADFPVLGALHFYGLSLGGFDPTDTRNRDVPGQKPHRYASQFAPSPLHGVPQDSWYRAARLIADVYGISSGPDSWKGLHPADRESNFRALWHTLDALARQGYAWVSQRPTSYTQPPPELLDTLLESEHTNWFRFKQHHGWVGVASGADRSALEHRLCFSWDDLTSRDDLAGHRAEAVANTRKSLRSNIQALEALGFYAVPKPAAAREEDDRVTLEVSAPHPLQTRFTQVAKWTPSAFVVALLALTCYQIGFLADAGWSPMGRSPVQWPSLMLLGPGGWVLAATLVATGAIVGGLGVLLARLPGVAMRVTGVLVILVGLALALQAIAPDGVLKPVHDAAYLVIPSGWFVAAVLVMLARWRDPGWKRITRASLVLLPAFVAALVGTSVDAIAQAARYVLFLVELVWLQLVAARLETPSGPAS